jgi:uncharacterized repeat protein (TIGR03803 family)
MLALLGMVVMVIPAASPASSTKILHAFKGQPDGIGPRGGLIFDKAGNLYGITEAGGAHDAGMVFKLKPNSNGSWTESVLYSFCSLVNCADGAAPVSGLVFDGVGNLYGTAGSVVFKLKPNLDGTWTESVLHNFAGPPDGEGPVGVLIFDVAGNLYGTTGGGGADDSGTVFQLKPNSNGTWAESVLYNFCSLASCTDGAQPEGGLVFDGAGRLYGTTSFGGSSTNCMNSCGTVFKLTPSIGGWTESVLHSFEGGDGAFPITAPTFDSTGNLYGETFRGGILSCKSPNPPGCGTVFKLTPNSDGSWAESVIRYFYTAATPDGSLTFDAAGNLYGTSIFGGPANDGRVFKLASRSGGGWAYSVLRYFYGEPALSPVGGVILDKSGHFYGMTNTCGGGYNCTGVVYEVIP